jgi:peptidoglycan/LPS O-acetylase OafA/YrhL
VLHLPVALFWPRFFPPGLIGDSRIVTAVISVLCGTGISYLMSLACWHLIEKRFLRLKDRFSYHSRNQIRRLAPKCRSIVTS